VHPTPRSGGFFSGRPHRSQFVAHAERSTKLRFGEIEPPFDAIEPIVHAIKPHTHLRYFARHVRDAALYRTEPAALFALFLAYIPELVPDCAKMFDNQVRRFLGMG